MLSLALPNHPKCVTGLSKEAWFYMRVGVSYKQKEITSESMSIKAKKNLDPELRASLTDADDGILRPGALPKIQTASAAGNKALLDSLAKAGAVVFQKRNQDLVTANIQSDNQYIYIYMGSIK